MQARECKRHNVLPETKVQEILEKIRATIREAAPDAEETIDLLRD
jgi:uncharacterized protein YdhG (YjbR/CyaY superfamily)